MASGTRWRRPRPFYGHLGFYLQVTITLAGRAIAHTVGSFDPVLNQFMDLCDNVFFDAGPFAAAAHQDGGEDAEDVWIFRQLGGSMRFIQNESAFVSAPLRVRPPNRWGDREYYSFFAQLPSNMEGDCLGFSFNLSIDWERKESGGMCVKNVYTEILCPPEFNDVIRSL
jgi:hypothetical protein